MDNSQPTYKAMYKYELARSAGVGMTTFRMWLKQMDEPLQALGVNVHTKMLPPSAVKLLCEHYCIEL